MSLTERPGTSRARRMAGGLRESDELYRLLAEHSTDMISKHTPAGVYTYASPACRSLLGYDPEDLVGRDAYEFFHPDDLEEIGRSHSAILERPDTYTVAYRIRRKDGSYTWFETTSRTVRDPATDEVLEIIAVSRDITGRKRTEEALKEALGDAKRYASQLRGLTDAALVVNAARSVDRMLQTITEQAREVIGAHLCVASLTIHDNSARSIKAVSHSDEYTERQARTRLPGHLTQAELETKPAVGRQGEPADEQSPPGWSLAAPLIGRDGGNIGMIQLSDKLEGEFDETDEAILAQFTHMASTALENAGLHQQAHSTIDSLSAHVAILDESGTIVATNRAWRRFAKENSSGDISPFLEGVNYLRVCDSATGPYSEESITFAEGIRAVLSGKRRMFELEYPCHSFEQQRWFVGRVTRFPDTEPPRVVVAHEDITGRKRTEEELRKSEVRFRAFFETAAVGAAQADPATGRFLQVNERLCRFLGYEMEELLCKTFSDITHPDDRPRSVEGVSKLLRGEVRDYTAEKRYIREDGRTVWGQVAVSLVRDATGAPLYTVAITQDITERKRLEESLREIREAERRRIARDLHDAVLQDLAGALQGMQATRVESPRLGSGLEPEIAALRRAVGSLRDAIYDLRAEKDRPFVRAVESLAELNRQLTSEREISLVVREGFPPQLPDLAEAELLRVLQEALVNARRHSDARRVEVVLSGTCRGVRVEVADDGVGFDTALVPVGVGLSGMRERASALGGTLRVQSTPGQGTAVSVEVPVPDPS